MFWRQCNPAEHCYLVTQHYTVTFQETWMFNNIDVRNCNLALLSVVWHVVYIPVWLNYLITDWLTYYLTNFMERSPPWKAKSSSASQDIPHVVWNLKLCYHDHYSPPSTVPIPTQSIVVHAFLSYFSKIHFNVILSSFKWSLFFWLPQQNLACIPLLPRSCHVHLIVLHLITPIIFAVQFKSWSSSLWNSLQSLVTSSLFSQTPSSAPSSQAPTACVLPLIR